MTEQATAAKDQVVSFHYELSDEAGRIVESSSDGDPTLALLGHQNLMLGLETALMGRTAGESFNVTLEPEQAFGLRREDWIQRVSKKNFAKGTRFQVGAQLRLQSEGEARTVTVLKVGNKFVDVDLNHPLAGQTIGFSVELLEVRPGTREELAHGHAHGVGGHIH